MPLVGFCCCGSFFFASVAISACLRLASKSAEPLPLPPTPPLTAPPAEGEACAGAGEVEEEGGWDAAGAAGESCDVAVPTTEAHNDTGERQQSITSAPSASTLSYTPLSPSLSS